VSAPLLGRRVGSAAVEVDRRRLGFVFPALGAWRDVRALVDLADGTRLESAEWHELADGGYEARCDGFAVALAVEPAARGLRLALTAVAHAEADVAAVGLQLRPELEGEAAAHWVQNGWQSWDAADVVPFEAAPARYSYSTAAVAGASGQALALAAASVRRWVTRMENRDGEVVLVQNCGPAPARSVMWQAAPGRRWRGEGLKLAAGRNAWAVLRSLVGGRRRAPRAGTPMGWLSWYHYGPWVTAEDVAANSQVLADGPLEGLGYQLVQIDDGWQMAYGDWIANNKFGRDLSATAELLRQRDQVMGIWTAPFLVSAGADLAAQAPADWFVHDAATGERLIDPVHMSFGPMYVLDASRRAVRNHLRDVFRRLHSDGVRYFKIDFLYAGAYAGVDALRAGVRAIREGVGREAYILACGAPLQPMVGLVDGSRVGQDTATPIYDFETGAPLARIFGDEVIWISRNVASRSFLDRWFQLDADVALVGANLTLGQARQLVTVAALSGGPFFASDDLLRLPPKRLDLLRNPEVLALVGGPPPRPDWEPRSEQVASIWRRDDGIIAAFNWSGPPRELIVQTTPRLRLRDLWERADVVITGDRISLDVQEQSVRLLSVRGARRLNAWLE
jgi:hypothetical protein